MADIMITHPVIGDFKTNKGFGIGAAGTPEEYDISVKVDGVSIVHNANGELQANLGESYILPPATTTSIGGVIVGNDLTVDASGVLGVDVASLGETFVNVTGDVMSGSLILENPSALITVGTMDGETNSSLHIFNDTANDAMGIGSKSYGVNKNVIHINRASGVGTSDLLMMKGEAYSKTDSDNRFVNVAGDTMTGQLLVSKQPGVNTKLAVHDSVDGDYLGMTMTDSAIELYKYVAGVAEGAILSVSRASGAVTSGTFYVKGEVYTKGEVYSKAESDARYEPIDSAYTKAESDARYRTPIGGILAMANGANPTDLFPGTTWAIQIDGRFAMGGNQSTVNFVGGSNTKTIEIGNLPAHGHSFTGTAHEHLNVGPDRGLNPGLPGLSSSTYIAGANGSGDHAYALAGDTTAPSRGRTSSVTSGGSNGSTGSGTALDITPAYTKLVFWKRLS